MVFWTILFYQGYRNHAKKQRQIRCFFWRKETIVPVSFGSLSNSVDEEPNEKRIQQKLDYLSPVEYRRR